MRHTLFKEGLATCVVLALIASVSSLPAGALSALLPQSKIMKLTHFKDVTCEYTSYHPGRDPASHRTTWPIGDILMALKERVEATEEDLEMIRSFNKNRNRQLLVDSKQGHTISVATDATHRHAAEMTGLPLDPASLYMFDLSSHSSQSTAYLCLEHQLNQGVIDAFITFDLQVATAFVSQRTVAELEEHFALWILLPDSRVQSLLAQPDKLFSALSGRAWTASAQTDFAFGRNHLSIDRCNSAQVKQHSHCEKQGRG